LKANPAGAIRAEELTFPCKSGICDVIFASSLFTHLLEPDAVHYLHETRRVLSRNGVALFSIRNNVPEGERFYGAENRIDIDPAYFVKLAARAGLKELDRIDEFCGQQVFVLQRAA